MKLASSLAALLLAIASATARRRRLAQLRGSSDNAFVDRHNQRAPEKRFEKNPVGMGQFVIPNDFNVADGRDARRVVLDEFLEKRVRRFCGVNDDVAVD